MRSDLIFRAQDHIGNRYELCRTAAKVTRRLHFLSTDTHDAINDAFTHLSHPHLHTRELRQKAEASTAA